MTNKRVCLGKIASAHGVRGLVKILPYGDDPSLIEALSPAYQGKHDTKTLGVRLKNPSGKYILAEIEGCTSKEQADALRGTELYYDRSALPALDEGELYYDDLIGLTVREDDTEIGHVQAVDNFGAGDLLDIKPADGGPNFYIPYHDDYIIEANLDADLLHARNIEAIKIS